MRRLQLAEPAAGTEAQLWSAGGDSDCLVIRHPSSWAAFAPSELPDFFATTRPLTPALWLFASTRRRLLLAVRRLGR